MVGDREDSVFVREVNGEENGEINGVVFFDPPRGGIECTVAQKSVPMFACFSLKLITPNRI